MSRRWLDAFLGEMLGEAACSNPTTHSCDSLGVSVGHHHALTRHVHTRPPEDSFLHEGSHQLEHRLGIIRGCRSKWVMATARCMATPPSKSASKDGARTQKAGHASDRPFGYSDDRALRRRLRPYRPCGRGPVPCGLRPHPCRRRLRRCCSRSASRTSCRAGSSRRWNAGRGRRSCAR